MQMMNVDYTGLFEQDGVEGGGVDRSGAALEEDPAGVGQQL